MNDILKKELTEKIAVELICNRSEQEVCNELINSVRTNGIHPIYKIILNGGMDCELIRYAAIDINSIDDELKIEVVEKRINGETVELKENIKMIIGTRFNPGLVTTKTFLMGEFNPIDITKDMFSINLQKLDILKKGFKNSKDKISFFLINLDDVRTIISYYYYLQLKEIIELNLNPLKTFKTNTAFDNGEIIYSYLTDKSYWLSNLNFNYTSLVKFKRLTARYHINSKLETVYFVDTHESKDEYEVLFQVMYPIKGKSTDRFDVDEFKSKHNIIKREHFWVKELYHRNITDLEETVNKYITKLINTLEDIDNQLKIYWYFTKNN